jgi:hypothetical protein
MKESKSMMKKEVGFMQKKGAPESMIKQEKKEMASKTEKYAKGGSVGSASKRADGVAKKGKTKGKMVTMSKGGMAC